jgi:hypothetical protein
MKSTIRFFGGWSSGGVAPRRVGGFVGGFQLVCWASKNKPAPRAAQTANKEKKKGPGDNEKINVWRNPEH